MMYSQFSPLYPLKGRIALASSHNRLATITPLRGQGVIILHNLNFRT